MNDDQQLAIAFPDHIPTHCKTQIFHFNKDGFLSRLDYNADVFWNCARGRHYCEDFKELGGLVIATHRYVYPWNWGFFKVMEGWVEEVKGQ